MTCLRNAIRADALQADPPTVILKRTSDLLGVTREGQYATSLFGLVDVEHHAVTLANGGHLPPVIDEQSAHLVDTNVGTPIGVSSDESSLSVEFSTAQGGALIAFTDGLVERRGESLDVGLEVRMVASEGAPPTSEDLLSKVVADLDNDGSDDTAILGLRWHS